MKSLLNIYRINTESQFSKLIYLLVIFASFVILHSLFLKPVLATYDPTSVPNNRYGIHIISPTVPEASYSASLVNTNGDWGYMTVLIESKDRNEAKWQSFFNELRRRHLIPIVRIATQPEGNYWKRPYEGEEIAWADFLNKLNWPTKNRYVVIYNEPNHATEWGGSVDPKNYAQVLDKTINALKKKSDDFFVMNAGFDASAPQKVPNYMDEEEFMNQMNQEVPGIFNRLDGWSSHSYPNPGFAGSPYDTGRKSIRGYQWEMQQLKDLGVNKNLPVFITETGWKHLEGIKDEDGLPTADEVADYYKEAFKSAWANPQVIAVTPFLLSYQEAPFDHFSFKKPDGQKQDVKILGVTYPDTKPIENEFYPQYYELQNMTKVNGKPIQINEMQVTKGAFYPSLVRGEKYEIPITVKNTGQSIWNDYISQQVSIQPIREGHYLDFKEVNIPAGTRIEPGQEYTFKIMVNPQNLEMQSLNFNLFAGVKQFDNPPSTHKVNIKNPVIIKIKGGLQWKEPSGSDYILQIAGKISKKITNIVLGNKGESKELEARYLLPDVEYDFTLSKPFYKPKTIHQKVDSGINTLDFGDLQPDLTSAVLAPRQLWKLLPF